LRFFVAPATAARYGPHTKREAGRSKVIDRIRAVGSAPRCIHGIRICHQAARSLLGLALCLAAAAARADDSPRFDPIVYLGWQYDSNLFRLPDEASARQRLGTTDRSMTDLRYGVGLDAGAPLSRQFLELKLDAIRNHFSEMDSLDYTDLLASARWRWRYGSLWSGDLGALYHQDISPFDELQLPVRDERQLYGVRGSATRRLTLNWDLGISAEHDGARHDLDARRFLDRDVERGAVDLLYHGTRDPENYIGVRFSPRRVRFPNRDVVQATRLDNSYREEEYTGRFKWKATGRSTFTADIGYSTLHHEQFSDRDFSGPVGSLAYRFEPWEYAGTEVGAWREIIVRTETAASYMTEEGLRVQPFWDYSPAIRLEAELSLLERRFRGDPLRSLAGLPTRRDDVAAAGLTATYSPYDGVELALLAHVERRDSNQNDKDYDYASFGANLEIRF
jgi:hypothetical protein